MVEEQATLNAESAVPQPARSFASRLGPWRRHIVLGIGATLLAAAGVYLRMSPPPPVAVSTAPVLPVMAYEAAPAPVPAPAPTHVSKPKAEEVVISDFYVISTEAGTVKASFLLKNRGALTNDYPTLSVRWQGVSEPEQLIRPDAYAHPPLPFKETDVVLELVRPEGATGIDVRVVY